MQCFAQSRIIRLRREKNITLVRCIFYLEGYQNKDLDLAVFTKLNNRAAAAKSLGVKMVLRFAYSKQTSADADLPQALEHIDQLAPWLQTNYSVIQVLESGFVGKYGEGYYTTHYGDQGTISAGQWTKRNAIIQRLLMVLPANRSIQVRTVEMKKDHFGPTVTVIGPPAKPEAARIGVHNDCLFGFYLNNLTDQGTYRDDTDKNFLATDSLYVPVGGEICGSVGPTPARTDCANAVAELSRFHWTHLSNGQGASTRDKWAAQGCMPQVERSLGYRLSLVGASFPASVPPRADVPGAGGDQEQRLGGAHRQPACPAGTPQHRHEVGVRSPVHVGPADEDLVPREVGPDHQPVRDRHRDLAGRLRAAPPAA